MVDFNVYEDMETVMIVSYSGEIIFKPGDMMVYGEAELSGKIVAYVCGLNAVDGKPVRDLKVCGYKEIPGFFNKIFLKKRALVPIPEEERQSVESGLLAALNFKPCSVDFLSNVSMAWA